MTKPLFFAAVLFILVGIASADIKTVTFNSDASSRIHLDNFRFTRTGHLNISVLRVAAESYTADPPNPFLLGFVLLAEVAIPQVNHEKRWNPSFCILDSRYALRTFRFNDLSPASHSCLVETPNTYRLVFANCASPLTAVTMTVRTELYNLDEKGSPDYLSAALTYISILGFWIYALLAYRSRCTDSLFWIHLLIAGLPLVKALSFICAFEAKHFVKVTGVPHGLDVMFVVLELAGNMGFSVVIFLIESVLLRSLKVWNSAKTMMVTVVAVHVVAWRFPVAGHIACFVAFAVYNCRPSREAKRRKSEYEFTVMLLFQALRAGLSVYALDTEAVNEYWAVEYWVVVQEIVNLLFCKGLQGNILSIDDKKNLSFVGGRERQSFQGPIIGSIGNLINAGVLSGICRWIPRNCNESANCIAKNRLSGSILDLSMTNCPPWLINCTNRDLAPL